VAFDALFERDLQDEHRADFRALLERGREAFCAMRTAVRI
jgi:hypothetical protein